MSTTPGETEAEEIQETIAESRGAFLGALVRALRALFRRKD